VPIALLLLIQGSGAVRAGQWARAVCLNDCLEQGSILPYLARAKKNGMGVIVFNPNLNVVDVPARVFSHADFLNPQTVLRPGGVKRVPIPGLRDAAAHTVTVFDEFVRARRRQTHRHCRALGRRALHNAAAARARERADAAPPRHRVHRLGALGLAARVAPRDRLLHAGPRADWVQSDKPLDTPITRRRFRAAPAVRASAPATPNTSTRRRRRSRVCLRFLCNKLGVKYDGDVEPIDYTLAETDANDN
jgi:hypothetical protein